MFWLLVFLLVAQRLELALEFGELLIAQRELRVKRGLLRSRAGYPLRSSCLRQLLRVRLRLQLES